MIWYKSQGKDSDVVISSRIRFARNFEGYPIGRRLSDKGAEEIIDKVKESLGGGYKTIPYSELSPLEATSYAEGHYVSPEFASAKNKRALLLNDVENISIMVCEEDHIRLQCIEPGFELEGAYKKALDADLALEAKMRYSFDEGLGYLTHCPTNLGTGMRASVMLFLPALTMTKQMPKISAQASKLGVTIRGAFGEGSEARGNLYQISNQITLGLREEDIIEKLSEMVGSIIGSEREVRAALLRDKGDILRDRLMRSYGVMKYAHMLTSEEFMNLWSDVRLALALGMISQDEISYDKLGELAVSTMPATLSLTTGAASSRDRDIARAAKVKE